MGQQQLLLLVIGIVIVGLAVLAGFQVFEHHTRQDEADGLLDRGLTIASHAVHWKTINDPFAGGNQSYADLALEGLSRLALDSTTVRGQFAITSATATTLEVTGVSSRYPEVGIRVFVNNYDVDSSYVRFDGSLSL